MNAKELIEYYEEAQKDYSRNVLVAPNYEKDVWRKKLQAATDTVSILSHTRIRETATEPPTREDADKNGYVLAYDPDLKLWVAPIWSWAKDSAYQLWTCMPQLPDTNP